MGGALSDMAKEKREDLVQCTRGSFTISQLFQWPFGKKISVHDFESFLFLSERTVINTMELEAETLEPHSSL